MENSHKTQVSSYHVSIWTGASMYFSPGPPCPKCSTMYPQSPRPLGQWNGRDLGIAMHSYLWPSLLAEGTTGALLKVLPWEDYPSPCPSRLSRSGLDWCSCPLLAWVVGRILNVPFKIPVFWLFNQSLTWVLLWWDFCLMKNKFYFVGTERKRSKTTVFLHWGESNV